MLCNVNLCKIDLSKAFDKVNHYALFVKLMDRRIPVCILSCILSIIENLFSGCRACVKWNNCFSDSKFIMNFGVRQGSVLSPFMFAVYIDGIAQLSNLRSNLFIVLYADDIILVAPTVGQLQRLFNSCQEVLDSLDMRINTQKSRCMRIGPRYDAKCVEICSSSGHVIPWVNEFRYLGVFIARSRVFKCSLDVCKKSFYRAANAVFGKVGRTASEEVTLQLVLSKCVSVLLYGLEACPLNASDIRSLDFVINRFFYEIV